MNKENCNVCVVCGLTQDQHKTNMHVFGIQIGCSWSAIKDYKLGTKEAKKTVSQEQFKEQFWNTVVSPGTFQELSSLVHDDVRWFVTMFAGS